MEEIQQQVIAESDAVGVDDWVVADVQRVEFSQRFQIGKLLDVADQVSADVQVLQLDELGELLE